MNKVKIDMVNALIHALKMVTNKDNSYYVINSAINIVTELNHAMEYIDSDIFESIDRAPSYMAELEVLQIVKREFDCEVDNSIYWGMSEDTEEFGD